jgi:hypothetical protein
MAKESEKKITLLWSAAAAIITFPLFLLFNYFGKSGEGRAAWLCAMTLLLAVKVRWELSKHLWFWITIASIAALHIPLITFVPWTAKWIPSFVILPFCIVDGIAILTLVQFVEKRMSPSVSAEKPSDL